MVWTRPESEKTVRKHLQRRKSELWQQKSLRNMFENGLFE
jgi:hypothetical protein